MDNEILLGAITMRLGIDTADLRKRIHEASIDVVMEAIKEATLADDSLKVNTLREIASRTALELPGVPSIDPDGPENMKDYHMRIAKHALAIRNDCNPTPGPRPEL